MRRGVGVLGARGRTGRRATGSRAYTGQTPRGHPPPSAGRQRNRPRPTEVSLALCGRDFRSPGVSPRVSPRALPLLVAVICLLLAAAAFGEGGPRFRGYTSAARVMGLALAGDRLWYATESEVLVLRDGRVERRMAPRATPAAQRVYGLVQRDGRVFALTAQGIFRLPEDRRHDPELFAETGEALCAVVDGDRLWVGTPAALVGLAFDGREVERRPSPVGAISALLINGGRLLVGGVGGLAAVSAGAWQKEELPVAAGSPVPAIRMLIRYRDQLYAGGVGGLWRQEGDAWKKLDAPLGPPLVRCACVFRGELWIGGDHELLSTTDGQSFRHYGSRGTSVLLSAPGAAGGEALVMGTVDRGAFQHAGRYWSLIPVPGPPPGPVTAVAWAGEALRIGTFDGAAASLSGVHWGNLGRPGPRGEGITHLVSWRGFLWFRTSDGALWKEVAERGRRHFEQVASPRWCSALMAADGQLCAGLPGALLVREGERWKRVAPPGAGSAAVTAAARVDGRWWIGTQRGLFRETAPGRWQHHTLGTGLPDPWVTALAGWGGSAWVGTFGGGLLRFTAGKWRSVPLPNGAGRVSALAAGRSLWCGTPTGLVQISRFGARTLDVQDGLPSAEVYSLAADGDRIAVGTSAGLGVATDRGD